MAYRVAGDPAAPPMLLLHALGESGHDWRGVLPELARSHRVHVPDLRGHGASGFPGQYSFELIRDDVLGLLDALGVPETVLIGHSLGAVVGLLVADAAPHRVPRLVLEDAPPPKPGALDRPPLEPPDEPPPYDFAVVNAIRQQLTNPDPQWWERSAGIAVPTLVVGGGPQSQIPQEILAELAGRMPDARFVTIAAGHHVHRNQPAAFVAAVRGFLDLGPAWAGAD
ncbi:alpha/beta fold hydrolase [Plantactinospora sp. WMMC1484]|uniref:alpha/beta fold hydrolase n=1 Tax=Plantactinospora sp. WMMC1484 TaxID=3404122 RepID=UPI003BF4BDAA